MDAVAGALITAILGGPILYLLGKRRQRFERLYERRAEVIADLSKSLYDTQRAFIVLTNVAPPDEAGRKQQVDDAQEAFNELVRNYHSNSIWLNQETCEEVEAFLDAVTPRMQEYMNNLDQQWAPQTRTGHDVGLWMKTEIPRLRESLEDQFRAILYPPPWYDAPLRILEQVQARNRQPSDSSQQEVHRETLH